MMLQALRSGAQGRTAKILFIVLISSFVLWGVGPILQGAGSVHHAAVVGSVKIPQAQVDQMMQETLRRVQAQAGRSPSQEEIDSILKPSLIRYLIQGSLFDQESRHVGLRISEDMIRQTIAGEPAFRDEQGKFSKQKYFGLLQAMGQSEPDFIRSLQQDLAHGALRGLVAAGSQPAKEIVKLTQTYTAETRTVEAVQVPLPKLETIPAGTAEELNDFYTKNSERYRAPEYRSFSYIMLDVAKIAEAATVTDDDLRKAYEENKADYTTPEERDLLTITTSSRETAEKVAEAAKTTGLEAAAKAANLKVQLLKGMTKAKTTAELADAAFSLAQGEVSAPLASDLAWTVLSVSAIKPASLMDFDTAKTEITARLRTEAAEKNLQDNLRNLEDMMAGGATLAEVSDKLKLPLVNIADIAQTGIHKDNTKLTDSDVLKNILPIAFATPDGQNSPPHDLEKGILVLHVDSVTESQIRPFEEVKAQVESGWKRARQQELAAQEASRRAETLKTEGKLAGLTRVGPIDRSGKGRDKLPNEAVAGIFGLAGGEVMTADSTDGSWVIKVVEVTHAEPKPEDLVVTAEKMKQDMAQERYTNFGQALWHQYGVTVDGQKIESAVQ